MKRISLTAGLLLVAFTSPVNAGLFDKTPKPVVLDFQGNRAEEFKQLVRDDSALEKVAKLTVPNPAKVAIATIRMHFATQSSASSTEDRPGGKTSSQYVDYNLLNVKPEDVQKIADTFYADLVKLLNSKGYQVQPQDFLLSESKFADAVASIKSPEASEALMKKEMAVTAYAKQTAPFSGMGHGGIDANAVSRAKSEAVLLELDFDVDIVALTKASDKGVWFQMHQIESKPALHVKSGWVRTHVGSNEVYFIFQEKTMLPGEVFANVEKKATSGTDTAAMVFGALLGAGGSSSSYNVTPVENFPEAVAKSLQPFAEVIANALPLPTTTAQPSVAQ